MVAVADVATACIAATTNDDCARAHANLANLSSAWADRLSALLRQIEAHEQKPSDDARRLAGVMYQAAGAYGMPVRVLDYLAKIAAGEPASDAGVLPVGQIEAPHPEPEYRVGTNEIPPLPCPQCGRPMEGLRMLAMPEGYMKPMSSFCVPCTQAAGAGPLPPHQEK
jgi:hypothetical protein